MTRPLLPPRGIEVPTGLLYDETIPPSVGWTWARLRGLAWGKAETPPLTARQIAEALSISVSSLYSHLSLLRTRMALQWHTAAAGTMVVTFTEPPCQDADAIPLPASDADPPQLATPVTLSQNSRNLEVPIPLSTTSTESLELERKRGVGGNHSRNLEQDSRNLESLPVAARVFVERGGQFPPGRLTDGTPRREKAIAVMVAQVGSASDNLERWGRVVEAYCQVWSPRSYTVMLNEYFLRGRIPGQGQVARAAPKNGANGHAASGVAKPAPSPERVAQMREELRAHKAAAQKAKQDATPDH